MGKATPSTIQICDRGRGIKSIDFFRKRGCFVGRDKGGWWRHGKEDVIGYSKVLWSGIHGNMTAEKKICSQTVIKLVKQKQRNNSLNKQFHFTFSVYSIIICSKIFAFIWLNANLWLHFIISDFFSTAFNCWLQLSVILQQLIEIKLASFIWYLPPLEYVKRVWPFKN